MSEQWDGRPQNPKQSGAHRLRHHGSDMECDALWSCGGTWLDLSGDFSATHAAAFYDYLGPCLTPAEVEARVAVARIEGAIVGADDLEAARREGIEALAVQFERMGDHFHAALVRAAGAALLEHGR